MSSRRSTTAIEAGGRHRARRNPRRTRVRRSSARRRRRRAPTQRHGPPSHHRHTVNRPGDGVAVGSPQHLRRRVRAADAGARTARAAASTRCACISRRSAASRCSRGDQEVRLAQRLEAGTLARGGARRDRVRAAVARALHRSCGLPCTRRRSSTQCDDRRGVAHRPFRHHARRRARQEAAHRGQPAARRVDRQALRRVAAWRCSTSSKRATSV